MMDPSSLSEPELYDKLRRYILPVEKLETYGYPRQDPVYPSRRKAPIKHGRPLQLRAQFASSYTCVRCDNVYKVDSEGVTLPAEKICVHHPKRRNACCGKYAPCSSNQYHVHEGELELKNYEEFVETRPKPERDPNMHGIYALDCEMCFTTYGLELIRVTVVNHKCDVVYESLVKPESRILNYNTIFHGIREGDLYNVKKSLADVQRDLLEMFSSKSILIGHGLEHDMIALKIFHSNFIDTAQLYPHNRGLPYKRALRTLITDYLKVNVQENAYHDSKEDAIAALRLVMLKLKNDSCGYR